MASLKEVKTRIASVNSTRKITSAMKMVASSKLHHAQQAIESMRPYEHQLSHIMSTFVANMEGSIESPYAGSREIKRVAIVVYTSNSSLCGAFNANVV
uniref:F0F1 ATP synthase subunit gamma n=1 Tax=Alloprevotella sp. TaxID=1872471 RepID=UPI004024CE8D